MLAAMDVAVRSGAVAICGHVHVPCSQERRKMHYFASSTSSTDSSPLFIPFAQRRKQQALGSLSLTDVDELSSPAPSRQSRRRRHSRKARAIATEVTTGYAVDGKEEKSLRVEHPKKSTLLQEAADDKGVEEALQGAALSSDAKSVEVNKKQAILVLMRHGQSMWNELKLFTGDADIPLAEKGVMEALAGGRAVKDFDFDIIFTSRLVRSKQTAMLTMTQNQSKKVPILVRGGYHGEGRIGDGNRLRLREAAMHAMDNAECRMIPVYAHPALNERCYGDLQGLNKERAAEEFGEEVVKEWRRSKTTSPPNGESLMDTAKRAVSYYKMVIEPRLREGKNVLLVSHGNVLRGLIAHLSGLSTEEMLRLQVATAFPYSYTYDGAKYTQYHGLKPLEDFITGQPLKDKPMGPASVLKKGTADSLI